MIKKFEVQNVKCSGCANTLKKALSGEFDNVEVDLSVTPRVVSLEIEDSDFDLLKRKLRSIGYPLVEDDLSALENVNAKAKSFVSCAIGKMNS